MFADALRLPAFPRAFQTYRRRTPRSGQDTPIYGAILRSVGTLQFLLVKGRHSGKWSFPKGHLEPSESDVECIRREVKEESGIHLDPAIDIPISTFQGRVGIYKEYIIDKIRPRPQDLEEIDAADWFSLSEVAEMSLNVDASFYFSKVHNIRCRPVTNSPPLPTLLSGDEPMAHREIPTLV
jgi:8-oxo-dGTP pyrophosphatase MutT (NUDIX family)